MREHGKLKLRSIGPEKLQAKCCVSLSNQREDPQLSLDFQRPSNQKIKMLKTTVLNVFDIHTVI